MSTDAWRLCVDRHLADAARWRSLDDEVSTQHGLSWTDFVILTVLDDAGGTATTAQLAQGLHLPASQLLLKLLPLEKVGLVDRVVESDDLRRIALRAAGRRLLREARDTVTRVCTR